MSWQDDAMIEQDMSDALWNMGEAEWRDMYKDDITYRYVDPYVTEAFEEMDRHHGWQRKEKND